VAGGIALLASLFPVFAKNAAGVSERTIGPLFLLNSLLIILAQLPVARAHEGHRRMTGLALTGILFGLAWVLVQTTEWLGPAAAVAALVVAMLVFGVGECLYDTVQGPLVADLAPEDSRSRYMAVSGFSWQLGFIAGPGLGGLLLSADSRALWPAAAALCLVAALGALALEKAIPPPYRTTPGKEAR
jgi:MFS family permease